MLTKEEMPACPVATTVSLIGSKWKLLILRNLLARPWRFNELKKDLSGISQKVLTDSLRSLEDDGIVIRTSLSRGPSPGGVFLERFGRVHAPHHRRHGAVGTCISEADTAQHLSLLCASLPPGPAAL